MGARAIWNRERARISIPVLICCSLASTVIAAPLRLERSVRCMGTEFSIEVYGDDIAKLEAASEDAFEEAKRIDNLLSNYKPGSELSILNRKAAEAPVAVSPELFDLLQQCTAASKASDGTFDITVGPLMNIWGFYKGSGHLPHQAEIRTALEQVGWQHIRLDPEKHTVSFDRQSLNLDPGGVGKGYAVDRMVAVLQQYGIRSALVSGGGSSIYGIGTPPDNPKGWPVRIRDPRAPGKTAVNINLRNQSVSTSGNYEKYFWAEGHLYSHIMDPRTGRPARGVLAVSVVTPRTLDSEIWAKPYYIQGRQWTIHHKQKDFQVLMCEDKPGVNCEWLQ